MFISCIVIDDEEASIRQLGKHIAKVPFLKLEASFSDPTQAILYLQSTPVDIIFVDIEMPNFNIDGMDVMRIAGQRHYIVTTAYPQYALKAFDHSVIDFLHKPFDFERFYRAVEKAQAVVEQERIVLSAQAPVKDNFTYIRSGGKLRQFYFDDIYWVESKRNTSTIFTATDEFRASLSMLSLESQLPNELFGRVNKTYLVSYQKVEFVERDQIAIKRGGVFQMITIGDQYRKSFMEFIGKNTIKKR